MGVEPVPSGARPGSQKGHDGRREMGEPQDGANEVLVA